MERFSEYAVNSLLIPFLFIWTVDSGQKAEADNWKTGSSFRTALNNKIRFQSTATLADDLASLSRNSRVAIFLDREFDPDVKVEFPSQTQPLGLTLDQVARQIGGLSLHVGSFVYIAPRKKALTFLMLREAQEYQISRLGQALKTKLGAATDMSWSFLATPRDIITVLAANCGLKISNPDTIPHDLWQETQLPRLSLGEQLTFLLASMNCTFVIDESTKSVQVLEFSPGQIFTLMYRKSDQRRIEKICSTAKLRQVKTVARGNNFFVRGPGSEMSVLVGQLQTKRNWKTEVKSGSRDVFDLNTNASRGSILATIAKNRNVKLAFAPSLADQLKQKVRVEVKQATVEELLKETLKGTGLRYRLTETQLLITR